MRVCFTQEYFPGYVEQADISPPEGEGWVLVNLQFEHLDDEEKTLVEAHWARFTCTSAD